MNILVTGSVAFDYLMRFPGHFRDHILLDRLESISLSFLVESMNRQRGGTAPNIAFTLALFGTRAKLFATVGEDFEEYGQWLETKGVDTSLVKVVPDEFTASFFVNTDHSNAQIASFYPGAMAHASDLSLRDIEGDPPDLVIISPNDPAAMAQYVDECAELSIPYLYDPSQQIVRLAPDQIERGLDGASGVFVNDYEFALVQSKLGLSEEELIPMTKFLVITRGNHGATIYAGEEVHPVPAVVPTQVVDPTGVGDAFRGGFLTGFLRGWDLALCGQMGALAATYCLESRGPQGHSYSMDEFVRRFRQNFKDQGLLDSLIESTHT